MRSTAAASHQRVDSPIMLSACVPSLCCRPGAAAPALSRLCLRSVPVPLPRRCPGSVRCRCPDSLLVSLSRCCSRLILCRSYEEAVKPLDRARARRHHRVDRSAGWRRAPLADHRSCCGCHPRPHPHQRGRDQHLSRGARGPRHNSRRRREVDLGGSRLSRQPNKHFQIRFRSVSDVLR